MEHPCLHSVDGSPVVELLPFLAELGATRLCDAVMPHPDGPQQWQLWLAGGKTFLVQWLDHGQGWEVYIPATTAYGAEASFAALRAATNFPSPPPGP